MRIALLASTIAFLAGSPALAQCVYVACNGGAQPSPVYQAPPQLPPAQTVPGYDEGYAAGLAARTTTTTTTSSRSHRPVTRSTAHKKKASPTRRATHVRATAPQNVAASGNRTRTHIARSRQPSHPRAQAVHRARSTQVVSNRTNRVTHSYHNPTFQDPIKDRAATYRPHVIGQSTTMASLMSRSSSRSVTTWSGPSTVVSQGGQVCGWGARIVTNSDGYAQRQAVWVCQCPQGWRPPGY
jgi:hypothetical protein